MNVSGKLETSSEVAGESCVVGAPGAGGARKWKRRPHKALIYRAAGCCSWVFPNFTLWPTKILGRESSSRHRRRKTARALIFVLTILGFFLAVGQGTASPASDSFARGANAVLFHSPAKAHVVNREILRLAALKGYGPIPPASHAGLSPAGQKGLLAVLIGLFLAMSGLTVWLWRGLGHSLAATPPSRAARRRR